MKDNTEIGKQMGSLRLLSQTVFALALVFLAAFPVSGFAATNRYLVENTPTFVDKIKTEYGDMVNIAALLQDYDEKLILSVIVIESEGNIRAKSHMGARGLMQLMPATAKSLGVTDPHDPFQNILAGTRYLKELEKYYGFKNPQEALVAYNMGPSRAKRWLSEYRAEDYPYVQKVMYVHNVLLDQERNRRAFVKAVKEKLEEDALIQSAPKPLLTKPQKLSLADLPFAVSDIRRTDMISVEEK